MSKELNIVEDDKIKLVVNKSDDMMKRIRVYFKNGAEVSIISGEYSYGGHEGLFEIMPSNSNMLGEHGEHDTVLGWLDVEDVEEYVRNIGSYTAEEVRNMG